MGLGVFRLAVFRDPGEACLSTHSSNPSLHPGIRGYRSEKGRAPGPEVLKSQTVIKMGTRELGGQSPLEERASPLAAPTVGQSWPESVLGIRVKHEHCVFKLLVLRLAWGKTLRLLL